MGKNIGILGGSFDPIHLKHLIIAQDTLEQMDLDGIFFIPTSISPLKHTQHPFVLPEHRLKMINFAIQDYPSFHLLDCEIRRGGQSYSIDTVRYLKKEYPNYTFSWIIGADQVQQLPQWKESEDLQRLIDFIVVKRPGYGVQSPSSNFHWIESHLFEISSTEIRSRVSKGQSVAHFLPQSVYQYIKDNQLYGKKE